MGFLHRRELRVSGTGAGKSAEGRVFALQKRRVRYEGSETVKYENYVTTCFENKVDCDHYQDGQCALLRNTIFRKPCPFYYPKWKKQAGNGQQKGEIINIKH